MSDWANDIYMMHNKFGVKEWFEKNKDDKDLMATYLKFRLSMCQEELGETLDAFDNKDPEEIVDGLIDMCVFDVLSVAIWLASNYVCFTGVLCTNVNLGFTRSRSLLVCFSVRVVGAFWEVLGAVFFVIFGSNRRIF